MGDGEASCKTQSIGRSSLQGKWHGMILASLCSLVCSLIAVECVVEISVCCFVRRRLVQSMSSVDN